MGKKGKERSPRRRHPLEFKVKVALEATQGDLTLDELAKKHDLCPGQVSDWKKRLKSAFRHARVSRRVDTPVEDERQESLEQDALKHTGDVDLGLVIDPGDNPRARINEIKHEMMDDGMEEQFKEEMLKLVNNLFVEIVSTVSAAKEDKLTENEVPRVPSVRREETV